MYKLKEEESDLILQNVDGNNPSSKIYKRIKYSHTKEWQWRNEAVETLVKALTKEGMKCVDIDLRDKSQLTIEFETVAVGCHWN